MDRFRVSALVIGVCLLLAVGARGQTQKPGGARPVDAAAATVSRPVEPDSPAASSAVAAGPQANGASPGMIVPRLMKFSGALLDSSGKPLSGAVDVTFALYNTEAGGSPLWFETQSVQADELGRYMALLGAMHTEGLPMDLFTSGEVRWLGIQVGLEAEQQPRVLLVSVPYALKAGDAETLGGKPASAYMLSDAQNASALAAAAASSTATSTAAGNGKKSTAQTSPLTACSVTSSGAAAANSLALFTASCNIENSAITQLNGNIGIGTAGPSFKLDVLDNNPNLTGFHLKNANAGNGALTQARLENDAGALAYEGIASSTFNQFAPINGGKAFWLSYQTDAVFGNQSSNNIIFSQNGAETARFNVLGRLGIGTASPGYKLDVLDNNIGVGGFHLKNPNSGNGAQSQARLENDVGAFAYEGIASSTFNQFAPINGGKAFWLSYQTDAVFGNQSSNNIIFTQSGAETARFDTSGRLGIGTPSPAAKLEVNGTAKFDQPVTLVAPATTGSPAAALSVQATDLNTANFGVYGTASGSGGTGVYGEADNGSLAVGVWGSSTGGLAGLFSGNVQISGSISKASGSFKIDHPLDPANKYLYHSFVESPDMKNIYDGVVTLDAQGEAVVQLPEWFEALNRDFRYQLTCVGGYAPIYIAQKIQNNSFKIAGGAGGLEVDWQVTGVRQDAWANAHRIPVEAEKPAQEQGYYLHPELFGAPPEKNIIRAEHEDLTKAAH